MLKSIIIVTIVVRQLAGVEAAWHDYLDYRTAGRGDVSVELAAAWGAPGAAGQPYVLMQPEGKAVYVRFVDGEVADGYAPMQTWGWNATELLVKDPDAITERLRESPFAIIGEPKDLWDAPNAPRAMQARGPGNEILYLTRNGNFETTLDVDRAFIIVLGGPSMQDLREFYGTQLGLAIGDSQPFRIGVLSDAMGLPDDTVFPLAVATVSPDYLLELDEYPGAARPRPVADGHLPPGTSMVSFGAVDLGKLDVEWRAEPRALDATPYNGRRAGVTVGPAGEWLEIIELSPTAD